MSKDLKPEEFLDFLGQLQKGEIRAAEPTASGWQVNAWVKEGILSIFKQAEMKEIHEWPGYIDKDFLLPRAFSLEDQVRVVPAGSAVRPGAYVGPKVVIMPPSYINIGAYVGAGTMVDSHVLVGSCAQIGENIHLSANVQIGGVLEPVSAQPVIVEDNAFIGAGSQILEGVRIGKGAVIAPNVTLTKSVDVFDLVAEKRLERGSDIPENAVVIPGSKALSAPWAREHGLSKYCAMIVKYRDQKSSAATVLEDVLR
ncbi:MAG: 2,3,4,5-tetrahydropyridine-2,6-dicarboxylate N-succinyltransferase [Rickettsiales bacterium]|nr:2,3,4,5-tetrahydropyridine-2,6-dicarboxylate N-succinyltransferase [Rickettsiales bacterium]|tara:strand:- start:31152 stop:31916 length:765 start_codon:yes stop_codon:yes gene_type:complete